MGDGAACSFALEHHNQESQLTKKIGIVYYTQGGSTGLLAEAVARGIRSEGVEAELHLIRGDQIQEGRWKDDAMLEALTKIDGIVFGAPTFMGGAAAQFKAFADATSGIWYSRKWVGKVGGGFTISGSPSGDKSMTLLSFATLGAQHGLLWANWNELPRQTDGTNRLGSSLALMAQNTGAMGAPPSLDEMDRISGEKYGSYLARVVLRLSPIPAATAVP
jgi:NAD(P)H dehydrogenase (quinone)